MTVNTPNTESYQDIFITKAAPDSSHIGYFDDVKNPLGKYTDLVRGSVMKSAYQQNISPQIVISEITDTTLVLHKVIAEIDQFLSVTYVSSSVSPLLEEAHHHVWSEVVNKTNTDIDDEITIAKDIAPDYISYAEYRYAKEHACRGCRTLVIEYDSYISKTIIGHYFTIRTILEFFMHEISCVREVTEDLIGDEYEDETEQKVAKEFYYWAISIKQYTKQLAQEITAIPPQLPQSELDTINKVEAAQFEAFFSLKVNSFQSETKKLLGLLKREMVDTCEMFYKNLLGPAMKSRSMIAYPLEIKLLSSTMRVKAPELAAEVVDAASSINGNIASLLADLNQKNINADKRFNAVRDIMREQRRFISYIRQLQLKSSATVKINPLYDNNIFVNVVEDQHAPYFEQAIVTNLKSQSFNSSHGYFNDLLEDHHPQYLMRSGGVITGDIEIAGTARIAGIDLANHSHDGTDGSSYVRASNIDYTQDREEASLLASSITDNFLSISVDSFAPDILTGGRPVVDVILSSEINIQEVDQRKYSIQISYVEIGE